MDSSKRMKAAVLRGVRDIRIEQRPLPKPKRGEALVEVSACGICNSDIPRYSKGEVYHLPLVLGHEFSGKVIETRGDSRSIKPAQRVVVYPLIPCHRCRWCRRGFYNLCSNYDYFGSRRDGGLAEYVAAPLENLIPVPEDVPLDVAAATEPVAVSFNAVGHIGPGRPRSAVIFGAGFIGLCIAQILRMKKVSRIWIIEIDERKESLARKLGFRRVINPRVVDVKEVIRGETKGQMADSAFEAAGVPETFLQALEVTGKLGKVVIVGNPTREVKIPKERLSTVLRKQLEIQGTWNSNILPRGKSHWQLTLRAIGSGKLQVEPLISHRFPLESVKEAFEMMREGKELRNKVIILMGKGDR